MVVLMEELAPIIGCGRKKEEENLQHRERGIDGGYSTAGEDLGWWR